MKIKIKSDNVLQFYSIPTESLPHWDYTLCLLSINKLPYQFVFFTTPRLFAVTSATTAGVTRMNTQKIFDRSLFQILSNLTLPVPPISSYLGLTVRILELTVLTFSYARPALPIGVPPMHVQRQAFARVNVIFLDPFLTRHFTGRKIFGHGQAGHCPFLITTPRSHFLHVHELRVVDTPNLDTQHFTLCGRDLQRCVQVSLREHFPSYTILPFPHSLHRQAFEVVRSRPSGLRQQTGLYSRVQEHDVVP